MAHSSLVNRFFLFLFSVKECVHPKTIFLHRKTVSHVQNLFCILHIKNLYCICTLHIFFCTSKKQVFTSNYYVCISIIYYIFCTSKVNTTKLQNKSPWSLSRPWPKPHFRTLQKIKFWMCKHSFYLYKVTFWMYKHKFWMNIFFDNGWEIVFFLKLYFQWI